MKKSIFVFFLHFAVLLVITLGLSGFAPMTAFGQSATHSLEQTFTSYFGYPVGTPIGIIDYNQNWIFNGSAWVSTSFNNSPGGGIATVNHFTVGTTTYISGTTQGDVLYYTTNAGSTWTILYSGGFPAGEFPQDITAVYNGSSIRWFVLTGGKLYEITGTSTKIEKLSYGSMDSFCSNMVDTIFVAMSTGNHRAYHIDNWATYLSMPGGLGSIDWKDNLLITVSPNGVKTRSTNPTASWESIITLDPTVQLEYCTWLTDASANVLDLAIGSNWYDQIQVWRQIVAPTADFTATPTSGIAPLTVQFTDLSTGSPTEWAWDFGDGGTSTEQNPSHTYTVADTFSVSLTTSNGAGSDTENKNNFITVNWLPMDASFTASPEVGVAPLSVQFTDQSAGNPTSWNWVFGDGGTSTLQNPEHIYTTPGSYTVALTVVGPGGTDTETMQNLITVQYPAPVADFVGVPTAGTSPLAVQFTNQSTGNITSYNWTFGDGGTSTLQNPSHTYNTVGTYDVSLTVTGPGGNDSEVKLAYITITEPAPTSQFVGNPLSGIAPLNVAFTNQSTGNITSYNWTFGDGGTSTLQNPSHTYNTVGTYDVSLTVTGPGGSDIETKLNYISVVEPVVITSFGGDPAGFFTRQPWTGNFTSQNATSASIVSSLGNGYSVNFTTGSIQSTSLTVTGDEVLTLTVTGPTGSDTESLTVPVYENHNLLADTIGSGDIQIFASPYEVSPDYIKYEMHLPMQDFYNLYNFTFQAVNTGSGIQIIAFATSGNTLVAEVVCNTTSNYQTFAIAQKESGLPWFQTGMIILLPTAGTLEMLSEDISGFVNPGDPITTKIFTGAPTNWTFTNETYNQVVYTDSHSETGITQKTVNAGNWTLGPILEQIIRIDVSNSTKTVSRYFMMDGTTGIASPADDNTVIVSPNPSNNRVNISGIIPGTALTVTDLQGKVLIEKIADSDNTEFDLTGYQPGVYFIKISQNGTNIFRKIVLR